MNSSSVHFIHTINGLSAMKILNRDLYGRPASRWKKLSNLYASEDTVIISKFLQHPATFQDFAGSGSTSEAEMFLLPVARTLKLDERMSQIDDEADSDNLIFDNITLKQFKSLCNAKKRKLLSNEPPNSCGRSSSCYDHSSAATNSEMVTALEAPSCRNEKLVKRVKISRIHPEKSSDCFPNLNGARNTPEDRINIVNSCKDNIIRNIEVSHLETENSGLSHECSTPFCSSKLQLSNGSIMEPSNANNFQINTKDQSTSNASVFENSSIALPHKDGDSSFDETDPCLASSFDKILQCSTDVSTECLESDLGYPSGILDDIGCKAKLGSSQAPCQNSSASHGLTVDGLNLFPLRPPEQSFDQSVTDNAILDMKSAVTEHFRYRPSSEGVTITEHYQEVLQPGQGGESAHDCNRLHAESSSSLVISTEKLHSSKEGLSSIMVTVGPIHSMTTLSKPTQDVSNSSNPKTGSNARRLLLNRKTISPTSQEKLLKEAGAGFSRLNSQKVSIKSEARSPNESSPRISKGILRTPKNRCSFSSTHAQKAVMFSQLQMRDIKSLVAKLLNGLVSIRSVAEETINCKAFPSVRPEYETNMKKTVDDVIKLEASARRELAVMSRDCNRFCKIMDSLQEKAVDSTVALKERKKISFADEAGHSLCDVKVFKEKASSCS